MSAEFARASGDHTFRKVDLSLFPTLPSMGGAAEVGFPPARFVAGRSKEAQRFISCLLTPLGGVASDPDMGSEFSEFIRSRSNFAFFYDIDSVFSAEALRVLVWMDRALGEDRPDDERIQDAILSRWNQQGTTMEIEITLTFADGVPGVVLFPVSLPTPENRPPSSQ